MEDIDLMVSAFLKRRFACQRRGSCPRYTLVVLGFGGKARQSASASPWRIRAVLLRSYPISGSVSIRQSTLHRISSSGVLSDIELLLYLATPPVIVLDYCISKCGSDELYTA